MLTLLAFVAGLVAGGFVAAFVFGIGVALGQDWKKQHEAVQPNEELTDEFDAEPEAAYTSPEWLKRPSEPIVIDFTELEKKKH
jgi:hypothetical protein